MELSRALPSAKNYPVGVIRLRQLRSHVVILVVRISVFRQQPTSQLRCFDLSTVALRREWVPCIARYFPALADATKTQAV